MRKLLLIGNPNTGKTTLFNMLTKSSEHTGNWHGVTVDYKAKNFEYSSEVFTLVDLPGVYSLSPNSYEEKVTVDYLEENHNSTILCLVDSANIYRNLYLAVEAIDRGLDTIILINITTKNFDFSVIKGLEKNLNTDVI